MSAQEQEVQAAALAAGDQGARLRHDVLVAVGEAEAYAFAWGVRSAANFIEQCGTARGGYFAQVASALAIMLREAKGFQP